MRMDINKLIADKNYCEYAFNHFLNKKLLKKSDRLFEKYINKALTNLEFANFILEEHKYSIREKLPNKTFYDWCITIYYYAIYHAALALLTKIGYEAKNHLATICAVTLFYYHKNNILKQKDIEFLIDNINLNKEDIDFVLGSKELRERASYKADEIFELRQAKKMQKETVEFINKIRGLLK